MKKILVADDTETGRELVKTVLASAGFDVVEAADGVEALQRAQDEIPDLIILDLHMPRLDGFGVIEQLRRNQLFMATPVMALTASAMQGDRERAMAAGFTGYVTKPIRLTMLRDEVERLLR